MLIYTESQRFVGLIKYESCKKFVFLFFLLLKTFQCVIDIIIFVLQVIYSGLF